MSTTVILKNSQGQIFNHKIEKQPRNMEQISAEEELVMQNVSNLFRDTDPMAALTVLQKIDKAIFPKNKAKIVKEEIEKQIATYDSSLKQGYNINKARNQAKKLKMLLQEHPKEMAALYRQELFEKYIELAQKNITTFMKSLHRRNDCESRINLAMQVLKKAKSPRDIEAIIPILYDEETRRALGKGGAAEAKFDKLYETHREAYLDILSGEVIKRYFARLLANHEQTDVLDFAADSFSKKNDSEVILKLDRNFPKTAITNGLFDFSVELLPEIFEEYFCTYTDTLCWNCKNAYASKCAKVFDIDKKHIGEYGCIGQGFQLIRDNNLEVFVVTACENFEEEDEQEMDSKRLRANVKALEKFYYGVNDDDELRVAKVKQLKRNR